MGTPGIKIFHNASWIIVSKLLQALCAFIISLLTARYLGPSNFGLINYAASIVTFAIPIAQLGLNNTLVQEITQAPEKEGQILGTSICMSLLSALLCMGGVISFAAVTNMGDREPVWIVAIYSLNLLFQVLDLSQYWFQAKLLSKYPSIATLVSYVLVSLYKLFLLITKKNVFWFAASHALDYFLIAVLLMVLYRKLGGQKLSCSLACGRRMLNTSKHYILAGLMVAIFAQTDKIMLNMMVGEAATGYYSAAVATASAFSFVYAAIIDSFRPVILSAQGEEANFRLHLKRVYCIVIWLSLFQSIVMTVLSDLFVYVLYGTEYAASSPLLRIVVWFLTFSYAGAVRNIWILAKGKHKLLWIINALGAALNVALNWILIPYFGAAGASFASVFTQLFTNFILGFLLPPLWEHNKILIQSLNPKILFKMIKRQ